MNLSQFLIYEDIRNIQKLGPPDTKQEKLIALGIAMITRNKDYISSCVKNALGVGVSKEEMLRIVATIVGDESFLECIMEVLRALGFEGNNRQNQISVIDDCKEE